MNPLSRREALDRQMAASSPVLPKGSEAEAFLRSEALVQHTKRRRGDGGGGGDMAAHPLGPPATNTTGDLATTTPTNFSTGNHAGQAGPCADRVFRHCEFVRQRVLTLCCPRCSNPVPDPIRDVLGTEGTQSWMAVGEARASGGEDAVAALPLLVRDRGVRKAEPLNLVYDLARLVVETYGAMWQAGVAELPAEGVSIEELDLPQIPLGSVCRKCRQCRTAFCGACMVDTSATCPAHVRRHCPVLGTEPGEVVDPRVIYRAQRARMAEGLRSYLGDMDPETRAAVVEKLRADCLVAGVPLQC